MKGSRILIILLLVLTVIVLTTPLAMSQGGDVIYACYNRESGILREADSPANCMPQEIPISWNITRIQGPEGLKGDTGTAGPVGAQRPAGPVSPFSRTFEDRDTANGVGALSFNSTGNPDTSIGYRAGFYATGSNNIHVNNEGDVGDAKTIRIGIVTPTVIYPTTHTKTFIAGTANGAVAGSMALINSDGQLAIATSRQFNDDIQDMGDAGSALLRLQGEGAANPRRRGEPMWIIGVGAYLALLIPVLLFLRGARIFEERYQKLEGTPYSPQDPLTPPQVPETYAPEPRLSLDPAFAARGVHR